jgi:hypothetical protein
MFNATFNNISVISWRSVLLVEVTEVPRENVIVYWDSNLIKIRSPYSSIFSIGCLLVNTWTSKQPTENREQVHMGLVNNRQKIGSKCRDLILTRLLGLVTTIYHTQGKHANHYTTYAVLKQDKWNQWLWPLYLTMSMGWRVTINRSLMS